MEVEQDGEGAKLDKGKGVARDEEVEGDAEGEEDADADGEAEESTSAATTGQATPAIDSSDATPAPTVPTGLGKAGGSAGNEAAPGAPAPLSRTQTAALEAQRAHAQAQHTFNLISFRNPIFDLDIQETVVDPLLLASLRASMTSSSSADPTTSTDTDDPFLSYDFATLFPDLPLYSDFIVATDQSLDRRIEDSSAWAGRLAHVTRLLESKPLLVSTLEPGRTRGIGGWSPNTAAALEDVKDPVDARETLPTTASGASLLLFRFEGISNRSIPQPSSPVANQRTLRSVRSSSR